MELNVARDECRKMLKRLEAFKAVDEVLEAAEFAVAAAAKARQEIADLEAEKMKLTANVGDLQIIIKTKFEALEELKAGHKKLIASLERAYQEREKELQGQYDQAEMEWSKHLADLKKAIGAAQSRLDEVKATIVEAETEYQNVVEKYEDFKRNL